MDEKNDPSAKRDGYSLAFADEARATDAFVDGGGGGPAPPLLLDERKGAADAPVPTTGVAARETWENKLDFIVSCVGFAVGLGNVWRFPYLCYKNGGGAFLIPYLIFIVVCGIPVFLLEISLGQFMKQGGIGIWNICPLMKGIGFASTVIVFFCNCYYVMVLAWALYYMSRSLAAVLPWSVCGNWWNTDSCSTDFNTNSSLLAANASGREMEWSNMTSAANWTIQRQVAVVRNASLTSPVVEFWEREVLRISSDITEPGEIRWQLAMCLLLAWLICFLCVCKGVRTTGKIVYFTALFPYVVLLILMVRGLTLPGSSEGITYYLTPNWTKLQESQVWIDAGTQVFFSYAIGLGALSALGSYNLYHNDCIKDCMIIAGVNSMTSFLAGVVIFAFLGFMSYEQKVDIDKVAAYGPGLAFIVYPKAVTLMPMAPFWSFLFFFMILLLGLDSQFVGVEGFLTAVIDQFPRHLRTRRVQFAAFCCCIFYLVGLSMVTQGGMYVFQIFDYYSASGMTLLWMSIWECVTVAWFYGASRYFEALKDMVGYRPPRFLKFCWLFITPATALAILLYSIVSHQPLVYNRTYEYPWWGILIGWCFAISSMICIPAGVVYQLIFAPGKNFMQRLQISMRPVYRKHHQGRYLGDERLANRNRWTDIFGSAYFRYGSQPGSTSPSTLSSTDSRLINSQEAVKLAQLN